MASWNEIQETKIPSLLCFLEAQKFQLIFKLIKRNISKPDYLVKGYAILRTEMSWWYVEKHSKDKENFHVSIVTDC